MSEQNNQLKLNRAINFFIGITLTNETLDEILQTDLFKNRNKVKGKALLKHFQPLEDKLYETFGITGDSEDELQFQDSVINIQELVKELVSLEQAEIRDILTSIKEYKKGKIPVEIPNQTALYFNENVQVVQ